MDNMVQRSVTRLLRHRGRSAVEVREVLGPRAPDAVVAEYANAERRVVITHDSQMADRCRRLALPHIWLRMRESAASERLTTELDAAEAALRSGQTRIEIRGPSLRSRS